MLDYLLWSEQTKLVKVLTVMVPCKTLTAATAVKLCNNEQLSFVYRVTVQAQRMAH